MNKNCHYSPVVENIYSRLFKPSELRTISVQAEASTKPISRSTIEKVNDELYFGRRDRDDDLCFVMVRLTDKNLAVWKSLYPQYGLQGSEELIAIWNDGWTHEQRKLMLDIEGGAMAFRNTLAMYEKPRENHPKPEVWIGYVLSGKGIDPSQPMQQGLFEHVEMVLTALTHPDVPCVVHMGIGRTICNLAKCYNGEMTQHRGLSVPLHGFMAKAILTTPQGGNKLWMCTHPTLPMAKILDENLTRGSFLKSNIDKSMPVVYDKGDESVVIKNSRGDEVSRISKIQQGEGVMDFYYHPQNSRPLPGYAVQYPSLASTF